MSKNLGDAFVRVRPDVDEFGNEVEARTTPGLKRVAKVAAAVLTGVAAKAAIDYSRGAIKLQAEFGKTMSVLQATTNAPAAAMGRLGDLALKMGADTVFSANDASKAMLELARGGLSTAQIEAGALHGTLTLAAAGELSMGEAANTAVKAMGQFNLKGADMSAIAAALAGGAAASSASVRDMSQALAQGGLAASAVGFSIQETTGILAAFSKNGLDGADAGTSLKTMLDRLVPTTDAARGAMSRLNIITDDGRNRFLKANGEFQDAATIARILHQETDKLSASKRKLELSTIFGSDAQRAATILAKEGAAGLVPLIKATSDQAAAQRMADANMRGSAGAIEAMKGSLETLQLAWGKVVEPLTIFGAQVVSVLANKATPIVTRFGEAFSKWMSGVNITDGLGGFIDRLTAKLANIDWATVSAGAGDFADAVSRLGPALGDASASTVSDTLSIFGVVVGFAADHVGTLAKLLPWLAAGFVAYKGAQAAANVVAIFGLPVKIAEVAVNWQLVRSNRALVASRAQLTTTTAAGTTVENVGVLTRMRSLAATALHTTATLAGAAAQRAIALATMAWTGVQWALNAALTANPIGLVVLAIAGLVAAIVLAWQHSETFRKIVTGAFDKVAGAASAAFGWVKKNWPLLLAILTGPIGLAVLTITRNWDRIKAGATGVKNWIVGRFDALVGFFTNLPSRIRETTVGMFDGIKDAFRSAINFVIDRWNALDLSIPAFDPPGPGPSFGGTGDLVPDIPRLWTGARVTRPTLAMIGDGSEPETVMNDTMLQKALARAARAGAGLFPQAGGQEKVERHYHFNGIQDLRLMAIAAAREEAFAGVL